MNATTGPSHPSRPTSPRGGPTGSFSSRELTHTRSKGLACWDHLRQRVSDRDHLLVGNGCSLVLPGDQMHSSCVLPSAAHLQACTRNGWTRSTDHVCVDWSSPPFMLIVHLAEPAARFKGPCSSTRRAFQYPASCAATGHRWCPGEQGLEATRGTAAR